MVSKSLATICFLGVLLAVLVAGWSVSGCGRDDDSDSLTLAVGGTPAELDFWRQLAADFTRDTGIEVRLSRQPSDTDLRRQGLVTALNSRQSNPDVFLMDVAWLGQFAASDWLEPLDGYVQDDTISLDGLFMQVVDQADRFDGSLLALPVYVDGGLLYYRKDLLAEHGFDAPPETWDELVEQAKTVQHARREQDKDFYGYVWQGAQYEGLICNWLEVAGSNGGGFDPDDGPIRLDTPANIRATAFMRDLIARHGISPPDTYSNMKEEEVRQYFQRGAAMFERNWPYAWAQHQSDESPIRGNVGIAPLPHFPGHQSVSVLGGWHVGVSKFSDNKPAAARFVQYVTSYDVQKRLVMNLGWNPGRKDVYLDQDVVARAPHLRDLRPIFENLRPRPRLPYYTVVSEQVQIHLNRAISGQATPEEALGQAQQAVEQVTRRYGQ